MSTTSAVPGMTQVVLHKVMTPIGVEIEVQGDDEQQAYIEARIAYESQADYESQSDKADLARILSMELMVHRWTTWLLAGKEYDGTLITDENSLRRMIQDFTDRITKTKESLKLDRKGRESDIAQSFEQRWRQLAEHAEELGVTRETQLDAALEMLQTLFAVVASYDRSDDEERERLGFPNDAAIVQFVRDQRPPFEAIDEHFRQTSQKYWVRKP